MYNIEIIDGKEYLIIDLSKVSQKEFERLKKWWESKNSK